MSQHMFRVTREYYTGAEMRQICERVEPLGVDFNYMSNPGNSITGYLSCRDYGWIDNRDTERRVEEALRDLPVAKRLGLS